MIQRGVVAYDEYRQHVYETYGERAAEEARYIFNPALAPPSWRESAAWAFDEIALGTGVYALEEAIIAMRSISRLRQAGATARLAANDLAHNRPVRLQLLAPAGGVAPKRFANPKEFQFADRTWFENTKGYRALKADIAKNGLENKLIEYVENVF